MATATKEFQSISSIPAFLRSTHRASGAGSSSEDHSASDRWDFNLGYDGAMEMAAKGGHWPEGAKDLLAAKVEVDAVANTDVAPAQDLEVAGHTVDIESYLAGAPDCMWNEGEDESKQKPIISFAIHIGRLGGVDAQSVLYRGAAILSIVDQLEEQGFNVELTAIWANNATERGNAKARMSCIIKHAQDAWAPSSIAFALCHSAFSRRLMWAAAERFKAANNLTKSNYGSGRGVKPEGYDVVFSWQDQDFSNGESALRAMQGEFNRQMKRKSK